MALFSDSMRGEELVAVYKTIWALAWPAFFAQGIRAIVMFIIRVICSELGDKAYNSVNVGLMIFMVIITVIAAVAVGTTALIAQSWGAGDRKQAGRILQQSLLWGFLLSLFIAFLGVPMSKLLFLLLGADAETKAMGASFMAWLFFTLPIMAPGFFLAAGLRAAGDTRTPMVGGIIMGVVALVLSYGLIPGNLGMPRLGILGAALAIGCSFSSFSLFLGVLFALNRTILRLPLRNWRFNVKIGIKMFKIGIPSAMEWIFIQLGMLIYVFVIYRYGDEAAAGYFTGMAILVFAQSPGFGFQAASATLVGQAVGAQDFKRAESMFRHCIIMSFMLMIIIGVAVFFLTTPPFLSFLFGKLSPEAIQHARTFIMLLVLVMPLMGIFFSMAGGLRGAGDTVPPLIASFIGVYGGRILTAFVLYTLFQPPVTLIWCSMFPDLILRIFGMSFRLRSGKWKKSYI